MASPHQKPRTIHIHNYKHTHPPPPPPPLYHISSASQSGSHAPQGGGGQDLQGGFEGVGDLISYTCHKLKISSFIEGTNIKKYKSIIFCILFNFSIIDIKIVDEIVCIIRPLLDIC